MHLNLSCAQARLPTGRPINRGGQTGQAGPKVQWAGTGINILVYNTILPISISLVFLWLRLHAGMPTGQLSRYNVIRETGEQQGLSPTPQCTVDSGPLAPLSNCKSGYIHSAQ